MDERGVANRNDDGCVLPELSITFDIDFDIKFYGESFVVTDGDMSGCKPGAKKWIARFIGVNGIV